MNKQLAKVDVVIVNYNGGNMLARCIAALQVQTMPDFTATIVDNGSQDGSMEQLQLNDPRFSTIMMGENSGFARGNNVGTAKGKAPWIATLNPDAFAEPDWLQQLLDAVEVDASIVMAGSTQITDHNPELLDGAGDLYSGIGYAWRGLYLRPLSRLPATGEVFGPCAAAAIYRRKQFEETGGFDERFFCYHEDVDLAFRMRMLGGRAIQVRKAVVTHVGSGITGTESPFAVYHGSRNRIWTYVQNMPLAALLLTAPLHTGLSLAFLVRAVIKGRFRPTWSGMRDGVLGLGEALKIRKNLQKNRITSSWSLLKAMTWSPVRFLTRDADVRKRPSWNKPPPRN